MSLSPEVKSNPRSKNKRIALGCGVLSLMLISLTIWMMTCIDNVPPALKLSASVNFDGSQFTIENKDSFDWADVKITLNGDYTLRASRILANQTYTVGVMQFTKSDGTRFNPFTTKVQDMYIRGKTDDGRYGSIAVGWK